MDPISRDEALAKIRELGLPSVVLDAFEERPVPKVLEWEMRDPYEVFVGGQAHYPPGRVIPLFSTHTGGTIVGFREGGGAPGFLRFCLETPDVDGDGRSWAQIITPTLISIWENHSGDELQAAASVREAAALLAFPFAGQLLTAVKEAAARENYEAWEARLIASLPPYRPGERDWQRPAP